MAFVSCGLVSSKPCPCHSCQILVPLKLAIDNNFDTPRSCECDHLPGCFQAMTKWRKSAQRGVGKSIRMLNNKTTGRHKTCDKSPMLVDQDKQVHRCSSDSPGLHTALSQRVGMGVEAKDLNLIWGNSPACPAQTSKEIWL